MQNIISMNLSDNFGHISGSILEQSEEVTPTGSYLFLRTKTSQVRINLDNITPTHSVRVKHGNYELLGTLTTRRIHAPRLNLDNTGL